MKEYGETVLNITTRLKNPKTYKVYILGCRWESKKYEWFIGKRQTKDIHNLVRWKSFALKFDTKEEAEAYRKKYNIKKTRILTLIQKY